jgi:transposase
MSSHSGIDRFPVSDVHSVSWLFGISVFNTIASQSHFSGASGIPLIETKVVAATLSLARQVLQVMINHIIEDIQVRIVGLEKQVLAWHKSNPVSRRLATIPGTGPIIATAIAATVADPNTFRSGREFAAWLGLVPRQNSTGGKARLGGISKRGDSYLRRAARQQCAHGAALLEASQDRPLVNLPARQKATACRRCRLGE